MHHKYLTGGGYGSSQSSNINYQYATWMSLNQGKTAVYGSSVFVGWLGEVITGCQLNRASCPPTNWDTNTGVVFRFGIISNDYHSIYCFCMLPVGEHACKTECLWHTDWQESQQYERNCDLYYPHIILTQKNTAQKSLPALCLNHFGTLHSKPFKVMNSKLLSAWGFVFQADRTSFRNECCKDRQHLYIKTTDPSPTPCTSVGKQRDRQDLVH